MSHSREMIDVTDIFSYFNCYNYKYKYALSFLHNILKCILELGNNLFFKLTHQCKKP